MSDTNDQARGRPAVGSLLQVDVTEEMVFAAYRKFDPRPPDMTAMLRRMLRAALDAAPEPEGKAPACAAPNAHPPEPANPALAEALALAETAHRYHDSRVTHALVALARAVQP